MKIQKGLVKYKDRSDIVCTYGITDEGKQYYFINDRKLSNNNIIVTSALVEAIDHSVVPANIGVINSDGNIVIDCVNKSIKLITKDILLVEKANPTSPSVVEALKNRKDPLAATKLVSNSAAIKEKMTTQMGSDARFIFNDQFSEASLFDISGKNLLNDKYYSFIALNKRGDTIYLSDNVQTSGVDSLSLTSMQFNDTTNVDASIPSNLSSDNKLDVTDASVNKENIDNAMNENITKLGDDTVSDVPPVVDDDPAVPEIPAVPEVPEDSSIESAPSVPVGVVVPPMNAVSEEAKEETNEVPAANEEKVEEKTEARKEDNEDGYTAIPAKAIDEMNDGEVPTSIDSVVDTSIEKEDASESTNNNETEVDSQDKEEKQEEIKEEEDSTEETSEDKEETEEKADDVEEPKEDVSADDLLAGLTGALDVKDETSDESTDVEDKSADESKEEIKEDDSSEETSENSEENEGKGENAEESGDDLNSEDILADLTAGIDSKKESDEEVTDVEDSSEENDEDVQEGVTEDKEEEEATADEEEAVKIDDEPAKIDDDSVDELLNGDSEIDDFLNSDTSSVLDDTYRYVPKKDSISTNSSSIMNNAVDTITRLIEANKNQKDELNQYKNQVTELTDLNKKVVDKARSDREKVKSSIQNYEVEITKLKAQMETLESKINEKESTIKNQTKELADLRAQVEGSNNLAKVLADAQSLLGE